MFDIELFLGFILSEAYSSQLDLLPDCERALFIQDQHCPYLQQVEVEGANYLGKSVGQVVDMARLDEATAHIYSLLKKLVPHFSYEKHPLVLLALPVSD